MQITTLILNTIIIVIPVIVIYYNWYYTLILLRNTVKFFTKASIKLNSYLSIQITKIGVPHKKYFKILGLEYKAESDRYLLYLENDDTLRGKEFFQVLWNTLQTVEE